MGKIGIFEIDQFYLNSDERSIKSDLLFFDQVFFIYNEPVLKRALVSPETSLLKYQSKMKEIEELEKVGLIKEIPELLQSNNYADEIVHTVANSFTNPANYLQKIVDFKLTSEEQLLIDKAKLLDEKLYFNTLNDMDIDLTNPVDFLSFWSKDRFVRQFIVRLYASYYRRQSPESEFIPIIRGSLNQEFLTGANMKTEVLKVILERMPRIDPSLSIDALHDFKNDTDSFAKQLALRNWVNDISKSNMTIPEIVDKFEYLLNEYESHLRLHRLKYDITQIETVVTATPSLLEHAIKFKFGEIAKMFFSYRKEEIQLMQSELDLAGKEIAFVHKAKEFFGSIKKPPRFGKA